MLIPREEFPLPEAPSRTEPVTLHHAGQRAQHITNWANPAPVTLTQLCPLTATCSWSEKSAEGGPRSNHDHNHQNEKHSSRY